MVRVPVCVVGCGPIGLTGALLLSRFGVDTLLIDKRTEVNTHPRSRFVDTNTMELMRDLGIEKAVEDTGLGSDWTAYNRWFPTLSQDAFAEIPSPTFHTVPRSTSPCLPVMTCQDYVEKVLLEQVQVASNIDLRFNTEALEMEEGEGHVRVRIRNADASEEEVVADYVIGADGPHSRTREIIGSELDSAPRPVYSQDVIFEADLTDVVRDRKAGLLYAATPNGVMVFQPLNGVTRWRCQIFGPEPVKLGVEEIVARIREAVGAAGPLEITVTSTGLWQPTPGCTTRLSAGRIFLAGDAAHVTVPTGGMGNNVGFAGVRNLAWKLAYVLQGHSPASILDSYEVEHRPLALDRIALGIDITEGVGKLFMAYYGGGDVAEGVAATRHYADYDGTILGFELASELIAENDAPAPAVEHPVMDFVPAVRAGRRAPHVWLNEAKGASVLDWFGRRYVLVAGPAVTAQRWERAVSELRAAHNFPIDVRVLPAGVAQPWSATGLALVRPDGIIANVWDDAACAPGEESDRISRVLPLRASA